jgi:hypothetical protein
MVSALPLEPVKHSRINVAVGWRASYAAGGGGGGFGGLGGGGFGGLGGSMGNPFNSFDHVVRSCRRRAWRSRRCLYYGGLDKVISPLPIALVEGR